jgi:N-acetyl-alpha-D-muramate 1-phosphate uridylyltransferase
MSLQHAIILAAGMGTRMRPLTLTRPKPLVEVAGVALIDYCLSWLHAAGMMKVVINTSYMADMLENHVTGHSTLHVSISREEPVPLETGGGIYKALHLLGNEPFLAMNSDAIMVHEGTHPVQHMQQQWNEHTHDFLMLLVHKKNVRGWEGNGDFIRDDAGRVRKPRQGEEAEFIFTGVEIIHPRVFTQVPGEVFSLNALWSRSLDHQGFYTRIHTVLLDGVWLNVGDLHGLAEAEAWLNC